MPLALVLTGQVQTPLPGNAAKYSATGAPIEVMGARTEHDSVITAPDRGRVSPRKTLSGPSASSGAWPAPTGQPAPAWD